ncbi:peptidoglycan-binding domain-containing protein [Streptomyces sp. AF1A]|jgi:peptidoglycan hydrolase-like protein with peptidoglycan-binding domain|uniref:peptidoglycan-binding domain-containing protein n=1 Tax=Streptomyces sp. AF1A TaxID=3394350 RepID=UPI0039BCBF6B
MRKSTRLLATAAAVLALSGAAAVPQATAAPAAGATRLAPASEHGCSPHHQSTIRRGSTGAAVTHAQCLLNYWGYNVGGVDGIFGSRTENQVRNFQRDRGLSVDGIVGPNTWAELHY